MKRGFYTRFIIPLLLVVILPVYSGFAKFWLEIKDINKNQQITGSSYIVALKTYQIRGIEFKAHFKNESDKTFICWLRLTPGTNSIPDYVDGWQDYEVRLEPGKEITLTNVIYIEPKANGVDDFTIEIARKFGLNPTDPINLYRRTIIVRTVESLLTHPEILPEPEFTRGTRNSVRWVPVDNCKSQDVYYFDNEDRTNLRKAAKGLYKALLSDTLTETFNNLKDGHKYGFFAKSVYETENGEEAYYSDVVYSVQDNSPPESIVQPDALIQRDVVVVTWNLVSDRLSGVSSYRIYRTADSGVEQRMAEINAEWLSSGQWIDSSAVGGHYYTYRIRAVDKVGNEGTGEVSNSVYIEGSGEIVIDNDTIDVTNDVRNGNFITGSIDTMWVRLDNREKFIRFQAVRDSLSYFSDPSSGSVRYFDSGWIVPDKLREFGWVSSTNYDSVYFVFDYSKSKNVYADENGSLLNPEPGTVELIDKNLVNGHTYLRRVSRKYYSTIHTEDLENIIPDCFPPEDIYNLKVYSVMQDAKIDNPSEGFTSFLMYLSWSKANDDASGLKRYHIYRKISLEGTYKEIVLPDDFINVSFVDTLSHLILNGISNPMVSYRVVAEDAAGNVRSIDSTDWEAVERIPGRPSMVFTTTEYPDVYPADPLQKDTIYTHEDYVELSVRNFDVSEIEKWSVLVNGVQQDPFDVIADTTLIIKLSDKEVSSVKVRGVYSGNRSSVWSKEKIVIRALSLSPENVSVSTDTNSWDGNISLQWTRPCLAARKYLVLRKTELSNWQIIGSIETEFDTIRWIDKYGIDETSNTNGDTLIVYRDYDYSVKTVNIMGDTSVAAPGNSKYCNRPPQISSNETPKIENGKYVLSIYWDRAVPSDASEGYKTVVRIYADSLEGSYEEEVVVDGTTFLYRTAVMNTNYIFRIKEVPDSPEGRQSAWSKPYIVPGLVTLPLQVIPQPRGNIYVNWYAPDLIKKYRIESYDVYRNDVKLTNLSSTATSFMDTAAGLVHGNAYTYKVNALNRMGQVVALSVKTDTCDTGSVYIPEIAAYTQKYFNKNYVTISWDWRKDGRIITGTTRGADSCMIQVSVSEYFPEDKERTVTEGPFKASPDSRTKMVNIPPLANRTNNRIYFRITSFDKFGNPGNPPLYWSSDFYNLKSAVYDTIPPYPVSTVSVDSVKAYYGGSDSIMVNLSWSGAGIQTQPEDTSISWDQLRGNVAEYRVERIINDNVELAGTIPVNKQSTVYSFTDILLNRKTEWRISSVDSAGNITVGTSFASPVFLPTPLPPEITGEKKCEVPQLTGQPDTVFYFIEIAMNPDHFSIAYELNDEEMMNRLLCRSGWINKTDFECTSGWGSIEKDTTWFRLKTGVKSGTQWWESGWSEKAFYVANQGSTNKNTGLSETTGIPENFRVGRNYPNPFNSETVIPYQLPVSSEINVSVYNISGSLVQVVESGTKNAGFHITRWNGKNSSGVSVSSGIYICVVSVRGKDGKAYQARIKLMYVK